MKFPPLIFFFFAILLVAACSRRNSVPKEYIQFEEMTKIIWDLSLAEDLVDNMHRKDTVRDKRRDIQVEYEKVFGVHKVTEKQFRDSYDYYKSHPTLYKTVLDTVHARSERRRADFFKMRS